MQVAGCLMMVNERLKAVLYSFKIDVYYILSTFIFGRLVTASCICIYCGSWE